MIVGNNEIGINGARALAAALSHVAVLKVLDVASNRIGDDGARALPAALQHVPGLKELSVG